MYAKLFLVCCTSARFKLWVEAKWGRVINKLSDLCGCETPGWCWSSAGGSNERRRTNMLGHRHQGFWQWICDTFLRYRSFPDYVSLKDTLSRRLWTLACLTPPARGLGLAQKGWKGCCSETKHDSDLTSLKSMKQSESDLWRKRKKRRTKIPWPAPTVVSSS